MTDKVIVLTTAGSEAEANKIARILIERKLAACVNIVPKMQSVYRWNGKIESAEEFLLLIKTGGQLFNRVQTAIRELHSYELPECIAIPVRQGSTEYLTWLEKEIES